MQTYLEELAIYNVIYLDNCICASNANQGISRGGILRPRTAAGRSLRLNKNQMNEHPHDVPKVVRTYIVVSDYGDDLARIGLAAILSKFTNNNLILG